MRAGLVKFIAGAAALILAGGAALLPALVPPRTDGLAVPAGQTAPFDGTLYVSVQGEGVAFPGSYAVPYGTTYGELFALAGFAGESPYPPEAPVRMGQDAVLGRDGIWRVYIVV